MRERLEQLLAASWPTRALRIGGAALALGALSLLVLRAAHFSHNEKFLTLLADQGWLYWLFSLAWVALLVARERLDPAGTRALFDDPLRYGAALVGLIGLAALPFTNAYFTHFTHPGLGLGLVWTTWPLLERLGKPVLSASKGFSEPLARLHPDRAAPWVAAVLSAAVIFAQSYRRHTWFGSGGKDLGLFHQSVWLLSQFETPFNTVMGMPAFADHMEFIDLAAAPLQWLWPSAGALLLFQALLVGLAAVPLFWLARDRLGSSTAAWAIVAVFMLGIDTQNAVMFDWNPTTCGVALMPWVAWTFDRPRVWPFALATAALALAKENLVIYALGLCLVLAFDPERRAHRRRGLIAVGLLALFFVVEMKLLFPLFRPEGFRHLRFEGLGRDPVEILGAVMESPYRAFSLLFTPGRKIDGLLAPLSTVGFVCLLAPRWVLALLPVVLERFWSSHTNRWWGYHYGIGAGLVTTLAAIDGLARIASWSKTKQAAQAWLPSAALLFVLVSCLLISSTGRFGPGPLWVWWQPYFTSVEDRRNAQAALAVIPPEAAVAAQNHLLPHLSARREIVEIRRPVRAEWVALDFAQSAWPFGDRYARRLADTLLGQGYGVVACEGEAVVLRRNSKSRPCPALGLPAVIDSDPAGGLGSEGAPQPPEGHQGDTDHHHGAPDHGEGEGPGVEQVGEAEQPG